MNLIEKMYVYQTYIRLISVLV